MACFQTVNVSWFKDQFVGTCELFHLPLGLYFFISCWFILNWVYLWESLNSVQLTLLYYDMELFLIFFLINFKTLLSHSLKLMMHYQLDALVVTMMNWLSHQTFTPNFPLCPKVPEPVTNLEIFLFVSFMVCPASNNVIWYL